MNFQQVVEAYALSLYRLAYSYCGSHADAEDVVQEVFLKYLQAAPECPSPEKLRTWLMTVTANKCKDLLRSAWRRNRQSLHETDAVSKPPDDQKDDVRAALLRLSPKNQAVVYLYYYEEMSTKEIAEVLRLSETAVRSRLFQARKHLKKLLGGD